MEKALSSAKISLVFTFINIIAAYAGPILLITSFVTVLFLALSIKSLLSAYLNKESGFNKKFPSVLLYATLPLLVQIAGIVSAVIGHDDAFSLFLSNQIYWAAIPLHIVMN